VGRGLEDRTAARKVKGERLGLRKEGLAGKRQKIKIRGKYGILGKVIFIDIRGGRM
jgi:hypothetical protein